MMLACPTLHHGLTPDGDHQWFCRQCGGRLYTAQPRPWQARRQPLQSIHLPIHHVIHRRERNRGSGDLLCPRPNSCKYLASATAATGWGASGNARLRLIPCVSMRLRLWPKASGSALTLRPNKPESGVLRPSTHPQLAQLATLPPHKYAPGYSPHNSVRPE